MNKKLNPLKIQMFLVAVDKGLHLVTDVGSSTKNVSWILHIYINLEESS